MFEFWKNLKQVSKALLARYEGNKYYKNEENTWTIGSHVYHLLNYERFRKNKYAAWYKDIFAPMLIKAWPDESMKKEEERYLIALYTRQRDLHSCNYKVHRSLKDIDAKYSALCDDTFEFKLSDENIEDMASDLYHVSAMNYSMYMADIRTYDKQTFVTNVLTSALRYLKQLKFTDVVQAETDSELVYVYLQCVQCFAVSRDNMAMDRIYEYVDCHEKLILAEEEDELDFEFVLNFARMRAMLNMLEYDEEYKTNVTQHLRDTICSSIEEEVNKCTTNTDYKLLLLCTGHAFYESCCPKPKVKKIIHIDDD